MVDRVEILVIGGGHAGVEAAWAAASALGGGGRVVLVTMDPAAIGRMSCNPAIGGLGKGQMVREVDALGGLMGRAADAAGIMFKLLNTSKGAAVRGPRCQADKYAYAAEVQRLLAGRPEIEVVAGRVDALELDGDRVIGVRLAAGGGPVAADSSAVERNGRRAAALRARGGEPGPATARHAEPPCELPGERKDEPPGPMEPVFPSTPDEAVRWSEARVLRAETVVLTTGTFMRGLMHVGEAQTAGGRVGEGGAGPIGDALAAAGFELGRLKTGTPPRLARETIAWDELEVQSPDADPVPFSDASPDGLPDGVFPHLPPIGCRITHTNPAVHDVVRANLHRAPMYSGRTEAECGPRYCPSLEDKIVRFADRDAHHVFLEPESLHTNEVYCNGISTSLPAEVQEAIVRGLPGCERATILRLGYAVEYDLVWPHQIDVTTMTKRVRGLFLAGQINCTTGYEEAAAQGLLAGVNAVRYLRGEELASLGRDEAYIGVMMDDLVTKPPREPYRMFTSRAEHRLRLRADNAATRLTPRAIELGLIGPEGRARFRRRQDDRAHVTGVLSSVRIEGKSLAEILRRPGTGPDDVRPYLERDVDPRVLAECVHDAQYAAFIERADAEAGRRAELEGRRLPAWLDAGQVSGLRSEAAEVLTRHRPATLGQASRLPGVNPSDVALLMVALRRGDPGTGAPADAIATGR